MNERSFFTWIAIRDGRFRFSSVEFKLRSGRKFRYQMEDYPFRVDASEAEIDALVCGIIRDKYRYCEWDRAHPYTNTEAEIFDAIKEWMLGQVAEAQRLRDDPSASIPILIGKPRVFAYWAIFFRERGDPGISIPRSRKSRASP
jgi:hypothetical protein